ncbi:L,D-transpeptidase family protein [Sphingobium aquiterrae]|uniref:L,D-transpeptidase family protein n=1 Tax=Sphingobium aquiterrae TaxID=2038656 RepID=UPI00301A416F
MKLTGGLVLVAVAGIATGLAARAPSDVPGAPRTAAVAKHAKAATLAKAAAPAPTAVAARQDNPLVIKRVLTITGPFRHGDWLWDDKGVPAGPLVITVDLKAQTLSVFRGGYEIGAAVIAYGADEMPTPLGVFPILQKDADHWSSLYDAPMPYTLRLTNDGVAIHGSQVARDKATHGCIGVPTAFAKLLFAQAKLGDRVIVTNGRMMDLSGVRTTGA